jgi:hypothetical protein
LYKDTGIKQNDKFKHKKFCIFFPLNLPPPLLRHALAKFFIQIRNPIPNLYKKFQISHLSTSVGVPLKNYGQAQFPSEMLKNCKFKLPVGKF